MYLYENLSNIYYKNNIGFGINAIYKIIFAILYIRNKCLAYIWGNTEKYSVISNELG